jgi:uncharacterized protein
MEWLLAALILGLAGSLHCVGMCGPLVLAIPFGSATKGQWISGRLINQSGRLLTYGLLGLIVGLIGERLVTAGFQQWLAVIAGLFMLLFIAWPAGMNRLNSGPLRLVGRLKRVFAHFIQKKGYTTLFLLGVLNGFLPCGLVYIALASSLALGNAIESAAFMMVFGLGTSPALMTVSGFGKLIREKVRFRAYRYVQITLAVASMLIILRGANLGIPFVSPKVEVIQEKVDCCSRPH